MIESILLWAFALLTAPLFAGVIFKVKAFFGGRKGSPLLINYYTLVKLFKKGSVYSTSTTFYSSWDRWSPWVLPPRRCSSCPSPATPRFFLLTGM
jgi:hypothetical protein